MSVAKRWHNTGAAVLTTIMGAALLTSCTADPPSEPPSDQLAALGTETGALGLPLVPWEGGPAYWKQFKKADQAGWSDPTFFPIVAWYDSVSTPEEAAFDKKLGINTYIGMPDTLDSSLLNDAGMFWIGGALNSTFTETTKSWVGSILDDEVDGRFSPQDGRDHLARRKESIPQGLFSYANFTYMVLENDLAAEDSEKYINDFTDAVSVDKYWYTIPHCSAEPYRDVSLVPVPQETCRTSSSYGKTMQSLRQRDAADGQLQPLWQFVENMGGTNNEKSFSGYISPDQLQGAVMSSIINEARGIVYFNQSFSGPCASSNVFRSAQVIKGFCGNPQVNAVKSVNLKIQKLAPVINSQSLKHVFGKDVSTMLKVQDSYAYLFAMPAGQGTSDRTELQWPNGVSGKRAEVLFESRAVDIDESGRMTDDFQSESTYHIYKVKL